MFLKNCGVIAKMALNARVNWFYVTIRWRQWNKTAVNFYLNANVEVLSVFVILYQNVFK
jgi:hypothetical protein